MEVWRLGRGICLTGSIGYRQWRLWLAEAKLRYPPGRPADLVDYLLARRDEPCAILKAISWIEKVAEFPEEQRATHGRLAWAAKDKITEILSEGARLIKRAPRYPCRGGATRGYPGPATSEPHVLEEQLKWPLENSPWEASLAWVPNYSSVEQHADFARAKFEEDVREGLMAKMSMGEFLERYGEHTAIAALAVIVEDEELDKKRIIHDATHGVRVNHRIRCRDKLRSPGAREKKHLLTEHEEEGETAFSVVGDIAKAHRRYKHSAKEHGYLPCEVDTKEEVPGDPASQTVYVNLLGPLGSPALATGGPASRRVG
ncbi:hypothetical protein AK812_SmicGene42135 [Symbiodinium microadriaticum]|uniref:Uncharacterized protein n=1 Tax=Symbiodinium microadriaticum TaxID=2951 RepID=A0A1Q9C4C6_SYMMI|nr:hypothetical protein AK812_SmicGene42135 [Symbiodinium microadriaticum]